MRPEYGCHLFRLLFSPNDATTAGLAMHYVRAAVERWEPRVEVVALTAERSEFNPGALEIRLQYRVRATQGIDSVVVDLPLSGGSPAGRTATGVRRP